MKFTPKTKSDLQSLLVFPEGFYDFEVIAAEDSISRNGNEMIKLELKIWDKRGKERIVYDYLLELMAFKFRNFCETTNLLDKYEKGELKAIDCKNKTGYVHVVIDPERPNPSGGFYPIKNSVKDYACKLKNNISNLQPLKIDDGLDQDIPF